MVSIRAAVWFKITLQGKSGHSGSSQTLNPIWMAHEVMSILKDYHSNLLNKLKSQKYYDQYENPMPLTFGKIYAGDWPSSCPDEAVIEGVLGFLPGMTEEQVCEGIKQTLLDNGSLLNEDNFDVKFTYRHNCCVIDEENVLVKDIIKAANRVDVNIEKAAMTASTDAWYYSEIAGVKVVAFGPGQLSCCHSSNESIKLTEIVDAGKILFESVKIFCG
jgi:acetylornithine deacetylase